MDPARNDGLYFLRRNPLFGPLGEDVLAEVARALKPFPLAKGAALVREGDPTDALFLLKSGRVRIVARSEKGEETPVAYLGRGEAIGELSLITGEPHAYSIIADTPCE